MTQTAPSSCHRTGVLATFTKWEQNKALSQQRSLQPRISISPPWQRGHHNEAVALAGLSKLLLHLLQHIARSPLRCRHRRPHYPLLCPQRHLRYWFLLHWLHHQCHRPLINRSPSQPCLQFLKRSSQTASRFKEPQRAKPSASSPALWKPSPIYGRT